MNSPTLLPAPPTGDSPNHIRPLSTKLIEGSSRDDSVVSPGEAKSGSSRETREEEGTKSGRDGSLRRSGHVGARSQAGSRHSSNQDAGMAVSRRIGGITERGSAACGSAAFSQREVIEEASRAGALRISSRRIKKGRLNPALEVAIVTLPGCSTHRRQVTRRRTAGSSKITIGEGMLSTNVGMPRGRAFTFIQRTAMSERSRMREVAERVLAGTLRP